MYLTKLLTGLKLVKYGFKFVWLCCCYVKTSQKQSGECKYRLAIKCTNIKVIFKMYLLLKEGVLVWQWGFAIGNLCFWNNFESCRKFWNVPSFGLRIAMPAALTKPQLCYIMFCFNTSIIPGFWGKNALFGIGFSAALIFLVYCLDHFNVSVGIIRYPVPQKALCLNGLTYYSFPLTWGFLFTVIARSCALFRDCMLKECFKTATPKNKFPHTPQYYHPISPSPMFVVTGRIAFVAGK